MNKLKNFLLKLKTFILLCMPLCFYIWLLRKVSTDRLQDYAGILGDNPKSLIVYHGVVIVDMNDFQI